MNQLWKRYFIIMLLIALAAASFTPIAAYASDKEKPQKLRVAFPQSEGYSETHEDGSRSGIFYDWLLEIAKYTGWEYEFVVEDPGELMKQLDAGELDLMAGMYYMDELKDIYAYPKYSVGSSSSLLLKRNDDASVQSFDMSTLHGKTIGVFKNAIKKTEQLKAFLSYNSVSCKIKTYEDPDELGTALDQKKIDLMLGSSTAITDDRAVAAQLGGEAYYIVVKKGSALFKQLDNAITNIYMADPNFASEVYAKYFPDYYDNVIALTKEDEKYIKSASPVRVAVVKDRYPLNYKANGKYKGVCQDVFELITKQTGLKFEFVYASNYQKMLDLVSSGHADIVGSFMDEESIAQKKDLMLTKEYVCLDEVVIKNKNVSYPSENLTLAVVEGRSVPKEITPGEVRYFATFADCIEAVENKKADVTFLPSTFVEDLFYSNDYTQAAIAAVNTTDSVISIAVPKKGHVELFSVLNKAINSIPKEELESLLSRNLASRGESHMSIKALIYANPVTFILVCICFLILVFLLILFYVRFRMKNNFMKAQLQKVQESSQAKSEFLSQMSHEIRTPMNAIIGLTQIALSSKDAPPLISKQLQEIQTSSQFLLSLVNDILDMSKIESSKMKLNPVAFKLRALMEQAESMMRVQVEKKDIKLIFQCKLQNEYFLGDVTRIKQVVINLLSNALKFTKPGGIICLTLSELQQEDGKAELLFSVKDTGIGIDKKDLELIFESFEQGSGINKIGQGTGLGLAISSNLVRLMGGELSVKSTLGVGSEFFFSIWLPLSKPFEEKTNICKEEKRRIAGTRILVAEDNDLNVEIVTYMLEAEGVTVERAADGQEVIDMFSNQPSGYYDMILMDIQMPVKSGLAATVEIRSLEHPDAQTIPIIAMTANTFKEDQDKAMEAGMNGFMPKPFEMEKLYDIVRSCSLKV